MEKNFKLKGRHDIDLWLNDYCIRYFTPDDSGYLNDLSLMINHIELINYDLKNNSALYEIVNAYCSETETHSIFLTFTPDNGYEELHGLCTLQDIKDFNTTGYEISLVITQHEVDDNELKEIDLNELM